MLAIDVGHSRLFPYAVRLAQMWRADEIHIEPRLKAEKSHCPDVLAIRRDPDGEKALLIECEWSIGQKFAVEGIKQRLAQALATGAFGNAEVRFILDGPAVYQKKRLRQFFGDAVVIHTRAELEKQFGTLTLMDLLAPATREDRFIQPIEAIEHVADHPNESGSRTSEHRNGAPDDTWRDEHDDPPDGLPDWIECAGCGRRLDPRTYNVVPDSSSETDGITRYPVIPGHRPFAVQCSTCAHVTAFGC